MLSSAPQAEFEESKRGSNPASGPEPAQPPSRRRTPELCEVHERKDKGAQRDSKQDSSKLCLRSL